MTDQPIPLWRAIAQTLSAEIAEGHYGVGEKLPPEVALAARFGVNRHTVRRALATLAEEGLVHAQRGAGVFVLSQPVAYPLSERVRFHQNLLEQGRRPEKSILSVAQHKASTEDARRLHLNEGEAVAVCHSLSFADGTPLALSESHFPEARYPGLAQALQDTSSVTEALKSVGVSDYTRVSTKLTATLATPTQAGHLRVDPGAPLLMTRALSHDKAGLPVEFGQSWFASERITLTVDHSGDVSGRT